MRKYIPYRHQTETVVVICLTCAIKAMINYDAELKKKTKRTKIWPKKVTQVSLWLSGENREWPVVTRPSLAHHPTEMQNQEDYWDNGRLPTTTKKAALTSSPTTKWALGLQYSNAPTCPVQLFHLLHKPTGSAADSQGLSRCDRWDLKDFVKGHFSAHCLGIKDQKWRNRCILQWKG